MGSGLGLNLSAQAAIHYFPSVPVIADYYFTMEFHGSRTCRSMVVGGSDYEVPSKCRVIDEVLGLDVGIWCICVDCRTIS